MQIQGEVGLNFMLYDTVKGNVWDQSYKSLLLMPVFIPLSAVIVSFKHLRKYGQILLVSRIMKMNKALSL